MPEFCTPHYCSDGPFFKYQFVVNGETCYGATSNRLNWDGTRYFVKFYPEEPSRNEILPIEADAGDIIALPEEGFTQLPHH